MGHTDFELLPRHLAEKYRRDDLAIMEHREPRHENRGTVPEPAGHPVVVPDQQVPDPSRPPTR